MLTHERQHIDPWQNPPMETALSSTGQIIWRWLERNGLDAGKLFSDAGVTQAALRDPAKRIPTSAWDEIRRHGMRLIGDSCAGLQAARCWHPSDIGALGYAWLASSTLKTALGRLELYGRIVGQSGRWRLERTTGGLTTTLAQTRQEPEDRALATDMAMSIVMDMCRVNFGDALRAVAVTLRRAKPECAAAYGAFYGGRVVFSCPEDSLTVSSSDAERLLPSSNKQLAGVHDRILTEQLARLDKHNVLARCKAAILERLATGEVTDEEVARALNMSIRTLQRRLEASGTGFSRLLDETRRELAERYLADSKHSISEVAFLLGFSQQSSLTRAANRWFGTSPSGFRQHLSAS